MSLTISVKEVVDSDNDPLLSIHETWERIELGLVASILNGAAFSSKLFSKQTGWPLIRIRDVGQESTNCFYTGEFEEKYSIESGDLLVGMDGDFRACVWHGPKALLNQRVCKIELKKKEYEPRFLELALPGYLTAIRRHTSAVTVTHLSSRDIAEIPLPLPPLAEQRRIVAAVERILDKVTAARARLDRVPKTLKRFRQAVLAAACSGRLTADWRIQNPDIETANGLLAKLRISADVDGPYEIPPTWQWLKFGSVLSEFRNGLSTKPSQTPPGVPILRINAVRSGDVSFDDLRYLDCSEAQKAEYTIRDNDLLFTRYNGSIDLLGVCGMVRGVNGRIMVYPDKLMRARMASPDILPEYCELFFGSPDARERMVGKSKSSAGQNGISGADVKAQSLALPPLAEQQEIVKRVSALFTRADAIEAAVTAARKRVDALTQAVLAKAFRGELVPTEAALARRENRPYEPAADLLARLQSTATAIAKPTRTRKTKTPPTS